MIPLSSKPLSQENLDFLEQRQNDIDNKPDFEAQAKRAKQLWDNKGSTAAKAAFAEIKETLLEMCVGTEICNYCENNEAADVEHIYPKKIFPKKAFKWENYLLACQKCNSTHKQEKFFVFNPENSAKVLDVKPPRGEFKAPPNEDAAFLDPRKEDPMDFLWLDLTPGCPTFLFREKAEEGTRSFEKATRTLEILQLNKRNALREARKAAAQFFLATLRLYIKVKKAQNFNELEPLDDFAEIDKSKDFEEEKTQIQANIQRDIRNHPHPTVWRELIRQRDHLPNTQALFMQAPEALEW